MFMFNNKSLSRKSKNTVFGLVISSLVSFNVLAESASVWQVDLKSSSVSSTVQSKDSSLHVSRLNQQDVVEQLKQREMTSLAWQSNKEQGLSDISLSFTEDEYSAVMGYRQKDVTFSAMVGSGKEYGRLASDYSSIDPYMFHGGNNLDFNYFGAAVNLDMSKLGNMQFGFANISANLLEDRRAQYMEWSNSRYFVRGNHFQRGSHDLGYGLDAGFYAGNVQVAYQGMALENDKSMHRIRFHYQKDNHRQFWFDVASHSNALYEENNDYRLMFSMRQTLGKKKFTPSYASEGEPSKEKQKKSIRRPVLIGVGVAAIAAASSSGSESQDNTNRIQLQHDAARNRLNEINPVSVRQNREFGGLIYRNQDGTFSSTAPVAGDATSVSIPDTVPVGTLATATYHTHAAFDPRFDNENFSPTDIESDASIGLDGYLGTPAGQFKYHEVSTGLISTLGTINN